MNGWILLTASFSLLYILASYGAPAQCSTYPCTPTALPNGLQVFGSYFYIAARGVASVFPAPFNSYLSTGILFLAGTLTLGLKLLDAPLGSGKRFQSLEGQLSKRPGVKNPAALAATIGRNKYGAKRFARLGRRRR